MGLENQGAVPVRWEKTSKDERQAMIKLNRTTEYALIAIQHIAQLPPGKRASVKDIATACQLPPVLLAKLLQKLKRQGVLKSTQGASGGYAMNLPMSEISLLEFMEVFEEQLALVECQNLAVEPCALTEICGIRHPMNLLNDLLTQQLRDLTLLELFGPGSTPHSDPAS